MQARRPLAAPLSHRCPKHPSPARLQAPAHRLALWPRRSTLLVPQWFLRAQSSHRRFGSRQRLILLWLRKYRRWRGEACQTMRLPRAAKPGTRCQVARQLLRLQKRSIRDRHLQNARQCHRQQPRSRRELATSLQRLKQTLQQRLQSPCRSEAQRCHLWFLSEANRRSRLIRPRFRCSRLRNQSQRAQKKICRLLLFRCAGRRHLLLR